MDLVSAENPFSLVPAKTLTGEKQPEYLKCSRWGQCPSGVALRKPEIKPHQYFELAIELNGKFVMA